MNLIRIQNYKRIAGEIKLINFVRVNYIVGPNGCGKSSILSALGSFASEPSQNLFLKENSHVIVYSGSTEHRVSAAHFYSEDKRISVIEKSQSATSLINVTVGPDSFNMINDTSQYVGMHPFKVEKVFDNEDPFSDDPPRRIFKHNEAEVKFEYLSSGLIELYGLRLFLRTSLARLEGNLDLGTVIFLIEEPEINLHPDFQKKIPQLFEDELAKVSGYVRDCVHIFVSTHSPFIISKSQNFPGHKVYPMYEGQFINLNGEKDNRSGGYTGSECLRVVAKMLGGEITDLGFPENFCLLEESSLLQILKRVRENELIKNIEFISTSGAPKLAKLDDVVSEIQNLNLLLKCNPLYVDNYLVILDHFQDLANNKNTKNSFERLSVIKEKLGARFTELSKYSLEDFYINISPEIHSQAVEEIATAVKERKSSKEIGDIKHKFALRIADLIVDQELFSMLFEGELDFLLR